MVLFCARLNFPIFFLLCRHSILVNRMLQIYLNIADISVFTSSGREPWPIRNRIVSCSVVDPKLFSSDPDPTFQEISDPDPT